MVANTNSKNVSELGERDGTLLGTFAVLTVPVALAPYDGYYDSCRWWLFDSMTSNQI
jgi:hypothetical protein